MTSIFLALPIPTETSEHIIQLQKGLDNIVWEHPRNFHITLRFVGSLSKPDLATLQTALNNLEISPFDIDIKSVGLFGFDQGTMPGYLWAGVEKSTALSDLKKQIDQLIDDLDIKVFKDNYTFTPHITIGRLHKNNPEAIKFYLEQHKDFTAPFFKATSFLTYESTSDSTGKLYAPLKEFPFKNTNKPCRSNALENKKKTRPII